MNTLLSVILIIYWLSFCNRKGANEYSTTVLSLTYQKDDRRVKNKVSLKDFYSQKADNGTILLMMTDYGYLDMFLNSYRVGNLSQYKNLVVLCMDAKSYRVLLSVVCEY